MQTLTLTDIEARNVVYWKQCLHQVDVAEVVLRGLTSEVVEAFFRHGLAPAGPARMRALRLLQCRFSDSATIAMVDSIELRQRAARTDTSIAALEHLHIEQRGLVVGVGELFPAWMVPRLQQLVQHVTLDTAGTHVLLE